MDARHIAVPRMGEIGADDRRGGGVLLDEIGPVGAAGERLDPDAAGAGIEVEHALRRDPERGEHREERAPDLVGHRPGELPGWSFQVKTPPFSRDHLRISWLGVVTALSVAPANIHVKDLVPQLVEGARGDVIGDRNFYGKSAGSHTRTL